MFPKSDGPERSVMLENKTVVVGVTGGIACYKSVSLVSALLKDGADVHVIMTKHATEFLNPYLFEARTGHKCMVDTFDRNFKYDIAHISVAKAADAFIIAPATANVIAKAANGIADDMLTTTLLAATCPKLVAPAMNTAMYENPITQDNLEKLRHYGFRIIEPASGLLACGDQGKGKMAEPEFLLDAVRAEIALPHDMKGQRILVTAGPTREPVDPVRFISNRSTGRMGFEIARAAHYRGAEVTLIAGPVSLETPEGVRRIDITTAAELHDAVMKEFPSCDYLFMASAVADYRPAEVADHKIKKKDGESTLALVRTRDILSDLADLREHQFVCGFSMETENLLENSRSKLSRKDLDMICANSLMEDGAGFGGQTNIVTIITSDGEFPLGLKSKFDTAVEILSYAKSVKENPMAR